MDERSHLIRVDGQHTTDGPMLIRSVPRTHKISADQVVRVGVPTFKTIVHPVTVIQSDQVESTETIARLRPEGDEDLPRMINYPVWAYKDPVSVIDSSTSSMGLIRVPLKVPTLQLPITHFSITAYPTHRGCGEVEDNISLK